MRELSTFASAGWQLLKTSEALAEANRQKDNFIALLAHELRNPLAAILTETSCLKRRALTNAEISEGLDAIDRESWPSWSAGG